jgi:protein TonB
MVRSRRGDAVEAYSECFARLGLEEGADERQVRRAYARELKLIDQERDLDGFQHLRACYETVLALARQVGPVGAGANETQAAPGSTPHEDIAASRSGAEILGLTDAEARTWLGSTDPRANGAAAFADFRVRIAALAALPERHAHYESWRVAHWTTALREALADPRLVHIEAPAIFEQHVADLLAGGWQPGHHLLLPAAVEVFGWDEEHGALERLGHTGLVLDAALAQRAIFQYQDILARTKQREVFHLLRQPWPPGRGKIGRHIGHLLTLVEHFPDMLHVLAPQAAVTVWREQCPGANPVPFALADQSPRAGKRSSGFGFPGALVIVFIAIMQVLTSHSGRGPSHDEAAGDMAQFASESIETVGAGQGIPSSGEDAEPLTAGEMEAIQKHADYSPGNSVLFTPQFARYRVTLDVDGNVVDIDQLERPADPAFGAAVEQAIRAAAPFRKRRSREFHVWFRAERTPPDASKPAAAS